MSNMSKLGYILQTMLLNCEITDLTAHMSTNNLSAGLQELLS